MLEMTQVHWWVPPVLLLLFTWIATYKTRTRWLKYNLRACCLIQIIPLPLMAPGDGALIPFFIFGGAYVGLAWALLSCIVYFVLSNQARPKSSSKRTISSSPR